MAVGFAGALLVQKQMMFIPQVASTFTEGALGLAGREPQDELAVRQVVQMVVWWGIFPCLAEGVGIPLAQRLQNASTCTWSSTL
jgi:hypothetical protein